MGGPGCMEVGTGQEQRGHDRGLRTLRGLFNVRQGGVAWTPTASTADWFEFSC